MKTETPRNMNGSVHVIVHPKGGVGKSCIASFIAGYLLDKGADVHCIDSDPLSKTLSSFKRFTMTVPKDMLDSGEVNQRSFDDIVEYVLLRDEKVYIVDIGPSAFLPFMQYIEETDLFDRKQLNRRRVYYHTPIVGSQSQQESINGATYIVSRTSSNVKIILWLNEFMGKIKAKEFSYEGIVREDGEFHACIRLAKLNAHTFGGDVRRMLTKYLSFEEALNSNEFSAKAKARLAITRDSLYASIEKAFA